MTGRSGLNHTRQWALPDIHGRSDGGIALLFGQPFTHTSRSCHPLGVRIILGMLQYAHAHTLVG